MNHCISYMEMSNYDLNVKKFRIIFFSKQFNFTLRPDKRLIISPNNKIMILMKIFKIKIT